MIRWRPSILELLGIDVIDHGNTGSYDWAHVREPQGATFFLVLKRFGTTLFGVYSPTEDQVTSFIIDPMRVVTSSKRLLLPMLFGFHYDPDSPPVGDGKEAQRDALHLKAHRSEAS